MNTMFLKTLREALADRGGIKAVAEQIAKPYSTLSNELNPYVEHQKLGFWDALELIRLSESEDVKGALARMLRGIFVPLPQANLEACVDSQKEALRTVKEFGDVIAIYNEAMSNRKIEPHELEDIEREAHEAQTAIQRFIEAVRLEAQTV